MPPEPAHWLIRALAEITVVVLSGLYLFILAIAYSYHWAAAGAILILTAVWWVRG